MDYRKAVKEILVSENSKCIGIHIPDDYDFIHQAKRAYQEIYAALVKHQAGKAFVQTTTELTRGPKENLHDHLIEKDPAYAKL